MEISELIGSLRCCGKDPNIQNCKNECAFYFDGLSVVHLDQCVKPMTQACADALKQLRAENAAQDAEIARLTALASDVSTLAAEIIQDNARLQGEVDDLTALAKARDEGRFVVLPFVAMVEKSLQDGNMKPERDQLFNGRYAVVYSGKGKWGCPLIDICGTPHNSGQADERKNELARAEAEAALKGENDG